MVNESLLKLLRHNIVVLIHEMYELGIEPEFWTEPTAQKNEILHINSASQGISCAKPGDEGAPSLA